MADLGNIIEDIALESPAYVAGLLSGDAIVSINGSPINDEIDIIFYSQSTVLNLVIKRKGKSINKIIEKDEYEVIGITLKPFKVKLCSNRCIFCFVSQLPKGLRKTLYIKDEDFRLSFQYGSYLTLSNLTSEDKKRVITQRLSPLYVSVHSTNDEIRRKMLRNPTAPPIMKELAYLVKNKIRLHTQIVLCPGINDGADLHNSINDLSKLYPYVNSIAVIPVGLTSNANTKIKPFTKQDALDALEIIEKAQKKLSKKYGDFIVHGADELYIKSGVKFPNIRDYGELSQIENGVGLVPQFMDMVKKFRKPLTPVNSSIITFTGVSFFPYLSKFVNRLNEKYGFDITLFPVENLFFGTSVTVTGLLTGRDILRTMMGNVKEDAVLLIPDVILRHGEHVLLDDITVEFIGQTLNVKTVIVDSTFEGFKEALINLSQESHLNDNISN